MAIGLPPKYSNDFSLNEISVKQFIVESVDIAEQFNWKVVSVSENTIVIYTQFSGKSWSEECRLVLENGVVNIESSCAGNQLLDFGKNRRNVEKFIDKWIDLRSTYKVEDVERRYEEIKLKFSEPGMSAVSVTGKKKFNNPLSFFLPVKGYLVTPIIIDLNILVFLIMVLSGVNILIPDSEALLNWGANFRPLTMEGQWWRLLTCCFLHIGIIHLLMNMYALVFIGILLEPLLGAKRFISAYLLTGIASSVTSLYWHDTTISAGASGAIFGMYGVFLALLTTNVVKKAERKALLSSIVLFVGYNLVYGTKSGVDNAAHVGGLLSGILLGYIFYPAFYKPAIKNIVNITITAGMVVVMVGAYFLYTNTSDDIGKYDQYMQEFAMNEQIAINRVYHISDGESEDTARIIWNRNLNLMEQIDKLKLPVELENRNQKIKTYCKLRIEACSLRSRYISIGDSIVRDSMTKCDVKLENILDELNRKGNGSS